MAPIARAAQVAGHTVAVACSPGRFPGVQAAGFEALSSGSSEPARTRERRPIEEVDVEREERHMRERFADAAARVRADGVKAIALEWLPDLVVSDEANFGAMIAAEQLDLPYATVLVIAAGTLIRAAVVAETLNRVARRLRSAGRPRLHRTEPIPGAVALSGIIARSGSSTTADDALLSVAAGRRARRTR